MAGKRAELPRACRLGRLVKRFPNKTGDCGHHTLVHLLLAGAERLQRRLRHHEGMVAPLHDVQRGRRTHPLAHALEKVERAEGVARPLREQDRRPEFQENLVAKLRSVTGGAKRIAEADHCWDWIDEGDVTAHASAHALAGEHDRPVVPGAKRGERRSMGGDELRQRVRPRSALQGLRIVERLNQAD
jgi:hypothetical protein